MSILSLMNKVHEKFAAKQHPFLNRQLAMRQSYLTGVAMQAYADGVVEEEEKALFLKIASSFDISHDQADDILAKAIYAGEETVLDIRTNLIDSKHKYYFILDLQIMAHQDAVVTDVESEIIQRFGDLLEIEPDDMRFLTELADALVEDDPNAKERWVDSFFSKLNVKTGAKPEDFNYYL